MSTANYLVRQSCGYCFRLVIPSDLRPAFGVFEFRRSLRTGSVEQAKIMSKVMAGRMRLLFDNLRTSSGDLPGLTKQQVKRLPDDFLQQLLDESEGVKFRSRSFVSQLQCLEPPVDHPYQQTKSLSEIIQLWINQNERAGNWSQSTRSEYPRMASVLLEALGDEPIASFTAQSIREFKELLLQLPAHFRTKKKYRGRSVHDLVKSRHSRTLSVKTINKYLTVAQGIFRYAADNGYRPDNPATGLQVNIRKAANQERDQFDTDDLVRIFTSPSYLKDRFNRGWQFWLPVLGLYTGCRLSEL